ncbi:GlcG/HbpS family heme-binding protein [Roseomonas sp. WA12]
MSITRQQAEAALVAASAEAEVLGVPMSIAVLDAGANLKAFMRMDGALLGSVDIAIGKAKTAVLFGLSTESVGDFSRPGGSSPGLEQTNGGLVVFAGGLPMHALNGEVIGGIGVSGGAVTQDRQVAAAALTSLATK